jgi:hypothetical protein
MGPDRVKINPPALIVLSALLQCPTGGVRPRHKVLKLGVRLVSLSFEVWVPRGPSVAVTSLVSIEYLK